jgi:hypothetical protein
MFPRGRRLPASRYTDPIPSRRLHRIAQEAPEGDKVASLLICYKSGMKWH